MVAPNSPQSNSTPTDQALNQFLSSLRTLPPRPESAKAITAIWQKAHDTNPLFAFMTTPNKIAMMEKAIQHLKTTIADAGVYSDAYKEEVEGAANGLTILLKNVDPSKEKEVTKLNQMLVNFENFIAIAKYNNQINVHVLIKQVLKLEPSLQGLLQDKEVIGMLKDFQLINGRRIPINVDKLISLLKFVSLDPEAKPMLRDFLDKCMIAKDKNLTELEKGKLLVVAAPHNTAASTAFAVLVPHIMGVFDNSESVDFKNTKELIYGLMDKSIVSNTQNLTESMRMIAEKFDPTYKPEHNEKDARFSYTRDKGREAGIKDDFYQRHNSNVLEKEDWNVSIPDPELKNLDPEGETWTRYSAFKTEQDLKVHSDVPLDLNKLGKLTPEKRLQVVKFLEFMEHYLIGQSSYEKGHRNWFEAYKPPESTPELLWYEDPSVVPEEVKNKVNELVPGLTPAQQEALIQQAAKFTFAVNYNYAYDLLKFGT